MPERGAARVRGVCDVDGWVRRALGTARGAVWRPGSAPGSLSESADRPQTVRFSASSPGVYILRVIRDLSTFRLQIMKSLRL